MAKQPKFTLKFAPEAIEHFDMIERKHHGLIRRAIKEQLSQEPTKETRNRKAVDQPAPFAATWELRCGPQNCFRIFYEVDSEAHTLWVLAIGVKERNRLYINGEEYRS
jgi:mRNA-degrading endonuclease RelE of RelBE toxin-antitoxin system